MANNPFVRQMHVVDVKRAPNGTVSVLILDRIEPGKTPAYCIHGQVPCHWCQEWCWLGDGSYAQVVAGECAPMCRQCGAEWIPKGMKRAGQIENH